MFWGENTFFSTGYVANVIVNGDVLVLHQVIHFFPRSRHLLGGKKAPAGTATPQHPGFERFVVFFGIPGCVLQVINLFLSGNY